MEELTAQISSQNLGLVVKLQRTLTFQLCLVRGVATESLVEGDKLFVSSPHDERVLRPVVTLRLMPGGVLKL